MKRLLTAICATVALYSSLQGQTYRSQRPYPMERVFYSEYVESTISQVCAQLMNPKLRWMFTNCYPNTLDTTVNYNEFEGVTFVYTGDIHAMWLRDSACQVWPYLIMCEGDPQVSDMIAGVLRQQFRFINTDRYANAFNPYDSGYGWSSDNTGVQQSPDVYERKWEVDSHCHVLRLAYGYWQTTGKTEVFDSEWIQAIENILLTFTEQQRKDGDGPYYFLRNTDRQLDTKARCGYGNPVNPVGLIASAFRPSDDATQFEFLVPSNIFAVDVLRKAAEILTTVNHRNDLAARCNSLASEVAAALRQYAVVSHPSFGPIYAYEVDGFGNCYLMDDANVPSLLSLAYLIPNMADDPVYKNTRRFVWSDSNPYFWRGTAAEGIGGPHIGTENIWPMSIMMKAFTATDDAEIKWCIQTLMDTDAGKGFIHESFNRNDASDYTRDWFAWQNSLFGELILKLIADGKLELLNSIR